MSFDKEFKRQIQIFEEWCERNNLKPIFGNYVIWKDRYKENIDTKEVKNNERKY